MPKGEIFLIVIAVVLFTGLVLVFPLTGMAKETYEINRQNAINYITAYRFSSDEGYQKEIKRLIAKYELQDIFGNGDNVSGANPLKALLNEHKSN